MTPEQKRKNAEVATALLCWTSVDAGIVPGSWLVREPELYINHDAGHVAFKKSDFLIEDWRYIKHLLKDMKSHQEEFQAEKKVLRARELLNRVVLSQKKHNTKLAAAKNDNPCPGEGISEPAIGPKPDAPPPAQSPKKAYIEHERKGGAADATRLATHGRPDARTMESGERKPFSMDSFFDGSPLAFCLWLNKEQEDLWNRWLLGLNIHRFKEISTHEALTKLLEFAVTEQSKRACDQHDRDYNSLGLVTINMTADLVVLWSEWLTELKKKEQSEDPRNYGPSQRDALRKALKLGIKHIHDADTSEAKQSIGTD